MMRSTKRGLGVLALSALMFAGVTACSGDAEESADLATLDDATTNSDDAAAESGADEPADDEAALLEVADCMRSNGAPDFPDPIVAADGTAGLDFANSGLDPQDPAFTQAIEVCGELLDGTTLGGGRFGDDPDTQDLLLEFAQCMRDNGVPDFEDPVAGSGGGPPAGGGGRPDLDDPAQQAAFEICQDQVNLPTPGGGS